MKFFARSHRKPGSGACLPEKSLLATALAVALVGGGAQRPAWAGTCPEGSPGSYTCSGDGTDKIRTSSIGATITTSGAVTGTSQSGGGISVVHSGAGTVDIEVKQGGSVTGGLIGIGVKSMSFTAPLPT